MNDSLGTPLSMTRLSLVRAGVMEMSLCTSDKVTGYREDDNDYSLVYTTQMVLDYSKSVLIGIYRFM